MNAATLRHPAMGPIVRTVLAVGEALVTWSRRGERARATAAAAESLNTLSAPPPELDAFTTQESRQRHELRRAAEHDRTVILARRGLGANQLLR